MKLKIVLVTFVLFLSFQVSFSQDYKSSTESVKILDSRIDQGSYNADKKAITDKLVLKVSGNQSNSKTKNDKFYSEKEWKKIQKQIKRNKKKVANRRDNIHSSKVIDTIYLDVPALSGESQLSGW
ncbi:hypothetical protein [Aquimarina sp. 2201CG5-10]|uniref:hypothetical protein n=1 Tax=Aquimarina callyspongiae TaxID=3098150 RepID=UPI002AB47D8B|nr:hypothetical protein [Aquimarina sp. 2201CG5-10]MDY8136534.1 hypothetical protein [Aquimarina sp. 2201CG5-10]